MTTCYLSPIGNSSQISTSGAPLSGGLIYTYQAGTSTPTPTYMDNSGAGGQANPIVLNTYGLPANPIWIPGGQAVKFVIKDALGNTIRTIDQVYGIDDPVSITQTQKTSIPAFSAYQSVAQSIPNATFTKVQLQTKEFDTANAFDSTTNYRFQPTVAGYYQLSGATTFNAIAGTAATIFKNGAEYKRGLLNAPTVNGFTSPVSALCYLNGTTDYVELYAYQTSGAAGNLSASAALTYFQGVLVRPA